MSSAIRGLRNKAADMALRMAGVFACIENATEVDVATLQRGMTMASFQRVTDKTSFRVQLDRKRVTKNTFDASGVVTAKEGLVRERSEVECA